MSTPVSTPPRDLPLRVVPVAASEFDVGTTVALVNAAFRRYSILRSDRTDAAQLLEEAGTDGEFLQVRADGRLVATAMVRPAAWYYAGEARLVGRVRLDEALYFGLAAVDPLLMNAGLGHRLVDAAEGLAAARGYRAVILGTLREFGLVEYYARLGYIVVAQVDYPEGHWGLSVRHRHCDMVKAL